VYFPDKMKRFTLIIFLIFCIGPLGNITKADILLQEFFSTGVLPAGWTNTAIQGAAVWNFQLAPAFGSGSGTYYAVFNDAALGAGVTPNQAQLATPTINCTGRTSVYLNYDHHWYGVESTHGYVEISNNGGATWTILKDYEKLTRGSLAAPQDTTINISAWAANQANVKVRFRYMDNFLAGQYWYIDDITIYSDPDAGITNLIAPGYLGCASSYGVNETVTVQIKNHGFLPISNIPVTCEITGGITQTLTGTYAGIIAPGATANYTFAATVNMSAQALYNFTIYTSLPGDQYLFNDTLITSRQQVISTYPYLADFNGSDFGWFRTGQSPPLNGGRNFYHGPIPYLNGPQGEGDSWYVQTTTSNDGTNIWVESPVFNFTGLTNPQLYIDLKHSLHPSDYFHVEYSLNGGTTWTQLGSTEPNWYNTANWWANSYTAPVNTWTTYQKSLCALANQPCVKFRIYGRPYYSAPTYTAYHYFAFDNIQIKNGPDVSVRAFIDPVNIGCLFSATQDVTVTIYNFGCAAISNVPVECVITGNVNTTLTGTVPGPIPAGGSVNYTFPGTFDMTTTGTYNFTAYTELASDVYLDNDTLALSIPVTQLLVNTFPYSENFDSGPNYWIASGQNPPGNNGRNFVLNALPYLNGPQGNGNSWYVETTVSNQGDNIWVESPVFDFSNLTNPTMSFVIKHSLHPSDYFHVEYSINGGTTWTQLGTGPSATWYNNTNWWQSSYTAPVNTWTAVEQELCFLSGEPCVKFRITGRPYYSEPTYTNYHYFAFDNFVIDDGEPDDILPVETILPSSGGCGAYGANEVVSVVIENKTCRPLYNVPVSLQLNGGPVINEVMPGPIPRFGFYIYTFTNTVNMSAAGTHTLTVTTNLATDGNTSNDVHSDTRRSNIPINTFPYLENFNAGNGGWISRTTSNTRLFVHDSLNYLNGAQGQGDSWFVRTSASNDGTNIWVESPVFNFTGLTNPQLILDLKHSLHPSDYFHVEYSLNGGTTWTQLGTGTEPNWYNTASWWASSYTAPVSNWTSYQKSLCPLANQPCVKLRIYGRPYYSEPTYTGYHYFAFDNVQIKDGPDVGVIAYVDPVNTGCLFGSNQDVTVTVYNYGCTPVSNVPIECVITGTASGTLTGTVPGPIPAGGSVNYTFPGTFNMTSVGTYNFNSYTLLPGDINPQNDDLAISINVNQLLVNTFPYSENFDSGPNYWIASGQNPPGNNGRNFVLNALPYLNGPQGNGNSWYVETTVSNQGDNIWVESPVFDFSNLTNPTMSFVIKHSLHPSDYFHVEYSINGGTTWTQLGTGPSATWYNNTNWWQSSYTAPVNTWTAVEQELCFLSGEPCVKFRITGRPYYSEPTYTNYHYFAFDNFVIDDGEPDDILPVETILPSSGGCGAYGANEVVSVVIENKTCRPLYNVPVSLQLNGGPVINEVMPGPIPRFGFYIYTFTNTVNMSAAGTHTLTVTTNLATDGNTSNDVHSDTRRSNIPINTFPYLENFNAGNGGWISRTTSNTRLFVHDSLNYLNGAQGQGDSWFVRTSASNDGTNIWVESPVFNFTGLTNPQLILDLKHSLHPSDYFHVEYSLNGGTTWTQLGTGTDPNWYNSASWWQNSYTTPVNTWTTYQKSLCALANQPCVKFRIYGRPYYSEPTYTGYHYFAFDNVQIIDGPDVGVTAFIAPVTQGCLYSTNQPVTVQVYNLGCGPVSNIPVVCDITGVLNTTLTGTVPGPIAAGSFVNYTFPSTINMTTIGSYSFNGYTNVVTDFNHTNDTTATTIAVNQVVINTFPYYEDFDAGAAYWIPTGSNPPGNNGRNFVLGALPYLNGPEGHGDSWYVQTTISNQGDNIWVESPVFNFTGITNPKMLFDIKHSLHSSDYFHVEYSTNGGTTWTQLGSGPSAYWYNNTNWWQNSYTAPVDSWKTVEIPLCNLANQPCVKFRIFGRPYYSSPTYTAYHYFAFDNFHITNTPLDAELTFVDGCYGSAYNLDVTVFNNNRLCLTSPTINSITLWYSIDGSAPVSQTFTGLNIPFGSSGTVSIPNVTVPTNGSQVIIWGTNPNGLTDQIWENDTIVGNLNLWPNCNDFCSNAIGVGIGTTTISQTSNASASPGIDPLFPCGNPTLENTVWYYFTTDAMGGEVTVSFLNTICSPSNNGIQVSINQINGPPCVMASYANVFCANNGNINDIVWGPIVLPPNTVYYITIDGYAGNDCVFDLVIDGAIVPLPVEFGNFSGYCNDSKVRLQWATYSENGSSYFDVEKSADGISFVKIGQVTAIGNSSNSNQYLFFDEQPQSGRNYFRLKQVDVNGNFVYTNTLGIECEETSEWIELYPNPTEHSSVLVLHSVNAVSAEITITDEIGKTVRKISIEELNGRNEINLSSDLSRGVYHVSVLYDNGISKFEKWVIMK
jgi:hypothetical protein